MTRNGWYALIAFATVVAAILYVNARPAPTPPINEAFMRCVREPYSGSASRHLQNCLESTR